MTARRHTTVQPIIDTRSQFVAFASSSIERCGVGSAAKLLSHNPALCELFGRDWVAGSCKQIGTTIAIPSAPGPVHVFMGVSATLGVVWCTCCEQLERNWGTCDINGCTQGDYDRFLEGSAWGNSAVLDSRGNVVATLDCGSQRLVPVYGVWKSNKKWLVKVDTSSNLVVWRMRNGVPVSSKGVAVKCVSPLGGLSASFSPFDPYGDELVFVGNCRQGPLISFVDLEKSVGAGVTVKARESASLPHSDPNVLLWPSPDTILTVHWDPSGHRVYNAMTGRLLHKFSETGFVLPVSREHIVWARKDSTCEVYRASCSEVSEPLCRYNCEPLNRDRGISSNPLCFVRQDEAPSAVARQDHLVTTAYIHYTMTGTQLAILTISNTP